jgi:hypothetical protein
MELRSVVYGCGFQFPGSSPFCCIVYQLPGAFIAIVLKICQKLPSGIVVEGADLMLEVQVRVPRAREW